MSRRTSRSPGFDAVLHAAFVGGVLLFTACSPGIGRSGDDIAAVARVLGVAHRDVAVAPGLGSGDTGAQGSRRSPACSASTAGTGELPDRLLVNGQERLVLSDAPARLDPARLDPAPRDLVIAFHGRTNDAASARRYFQLDGALPDAVIAYPQALPAGPGTFAWSDPGDPPEALRDFDLVDAIVDTFGQARCIDLERVFVVGHSLGAYFANDVACHLADRVRAVASVAGGLQAGVCAAGTAAILLHHPDDPLVPLSAGERARDVFLAADGLWDTQATPAEHPALAPLRCVRYGDDDVPDPVVWCAHGEATWPGGRFDPHAWPAGAPAAIAAFFQHLP